MEMLDSEQSLDFLEYFFKKYINSESLNSFIEEIEKARIRNKEDNTDSVPIRDLHEKLMEYRKKNKDYFEFTKKEDDIWNELLAHWI